MQNCKIIIKKTIYLKNANIIHNFLFISLTTQNEWIQSHLKKSRRTLRTYQHKILCRKWNENEWNKPSEYLFQDCFPFYCWHCLTKHRAHHLLETHTYVICSKWINRSSSLIYYKAWHNINVALILFNYRFFSLKCTSRQKKV